MAGLHILVFCCVSFMGLMLIPLLFIRVPRIALHMVAEKKKEEAGSPFRYYEFMFRKYSMYAYFPLAFVLQIISGAGIYCKYSSPAL